MDINELYIELQKSVYDKRPYHRIKDLGEGMEIVEELSPTIGVSGFLSTTRLKKPMR